MIPYFKGRLASIFNLLSEEGTRFSRSLNEYLSVFYGDTAVSCWKPALACGCALFGPDNIVFGTDYPHGPEGGAAYVRDHISGVSEMAISEEDKVKIFEGNATKLSKLRI